MTFGFPKPLRGSSLLASRERTADRKAHERKAMDAAKRRDGHQCRFPRCKYAAKKLPIDASHFLQHRGIGGDKGGLRTRQDLILSLCRIHHSMLDLGEIDIQPLTEANADGPLCFYERNHDAGGSFQHVATERSIGVPGTRGL